jgi:ATP-dependent Clp protease adaptor protein ClpS
VLELLLLGGVPASVWLIERMRRAKHVRLHAQFLATLDGDVQVVLHVANHEAATRSQALDPLHLAYGLLQNEDIRERITGLGGDPARVEDEVNTALDRLGDAGHARDALEALAYVSAVANHLSRQATCAELWARLARNGAVVAAFDAGGLPAHRLLFAMIHGMDPPAPRLAAPGSVHVVLRNDDVTTVEFVTSVLREVFELDPETASKVTLQTHEQGRAIVGRFPPEVAATHVESARSRARAAGFPLWVGVEPC